MDLRPLGDGINWVAVAMPHAAIRTDTTGAAPGLRRIYAAVKRTIEEVGLQMGCLSVRKSNVCEAERRGTNQKGMRGAKTLDEGRGRLRLC
jgi:hypothetical protein